MLLPACVISAPSDGGQPGPCGGRACSEHGYCQRGTDECRCDSGYVGNPYAAFGCQAAAPGGDCSTTCGLNAYCAEGQAGDPSACVCDDGFVAVCGTGDCVPEAVLCDGTADCANEADEHPDVCFETVQMEWTVVDDCDDGDAVQWRVWAADRDWVWPGPDVTFFSGMVFEPSTEAIECFEGELVCFGGSASDTDWGVGMSGTIACDDCCERCGAVSIDYGALSCP